jgi:hypothetical protein
MGFILGVIYGVLLTLLIVFTALIETTEQGKD